MNLRKQIFISFLFVAIIPLLIVNLYLYRSNVNLAFDLYQQNLNNSTKIQTDIIEEHINRMIVRSNRFTLALDKCGIMDQDKQKKILENKTAADEILKFTEETLESLSVFALVNEDGDIVYSSGSNHDTAMVKEVASSLTVSNRDYVQEVLVDKKDYRIAIVIPMPSGGKLVAIYSNDFLLKTMSGQIQIKSSNAFLYCLNHESLVKMKKQVTGTLDDFTKKLTNKPEGSLTCMIGNQKNAVYYKTIEKTPWILVNYIPVGQVYSSVFTYTIMNMVVFLVCLAVVVILSRLQSKRILQPMNWLLHTVEDFFISGAANFKNVHINNKTEIGYLSEKFEGMATDIQAVQAKLRESNYLYEAILHSSYELYITIDYDEDYAVSSMKNMNFESENNRKVSAPQLVFDYFTYYSFDTNEWDISLLEKMIYGKLDSPTEGDISIKTVTGEVCWYRIVAVPIFDEAKVLHKSVLYFKNITDQKKEELKLKYSSQRDSLCGLLNKGALIELAEKIEEDMNAIFFIDLDNFKQVNDHLGHLAGDQVLFHVATILTESFRSEDLVCRYGGDEFVIFVSEMTDSAVKKKAENLVKNLRFVRELNGEERIIVTASVGVWISNKKEKIEIMIKHADKAMYTAKQNGKSQYCIMGDNIDSKLGGAGQI